ncbi:unnamed protein product [Adineta steineri]|uniref:Uncharacterized protein n=1 Tax=Adineta steineri TaxID=433720 RepID=A0A815KI83_9BILA|nr:unnamed protein product [Adineta steineri]CAF1393251.1 unnamed protein product [Adineta steineri]
MTHFQQCLDKLTGENEVNAKRVHQQHQERIVKIREEINDKTLSENERVVKRSLVKEYESQLKTYEATIRSLVDAPDSTNQHLENRRLRALTREINRLELHLPIYARRDDIINAVRTNQILILNADTGAGKSTQVVQYLADSDLVDHGEIVCTQPRRFAARALADHVAKEFGCCVGEEIGIHLDAKGPKVSKLTKIRIVTENVLLNQYRQDRMLSSYSIVIIDEAHERRIDTDLLLGVMKLCVAQRPDIKLIIMSATLDIKLVSRYYPGSHVLEVAGRTYPIEDRFCEKDIDDYVDGAIQFACAIHRNNLPGDILAFLTGPDEIDRAVAEVQQNLKDAVKVLPLHGKLQAEEMTEIFKKTPLKRKIIFSTNLAETSVTIDGVQHVIDSGMVKEMIWDEKQKMQVLKTGRTTQNSVKQRRGRAGRTSPGTCYHLYTEKTLTAMLMCPRSEILSTEPSIAVLKLKHLGVVDNAENFDWVEAPSKESIRHAVHRLRWLNAIDLKSNQLTETGDRMAQLGFSPMLSAMILDSLDMNCMMTLCVITLDSKIEAWQNSRSDKPVDCNFVSSTTFNSTPTSCQTSVLKNTNQHSGTSVKPGPSKSAQQVQEKAEILSVTSDSSLKDHRIVVYVPDLPATISDSKLLETDIAKFLDIKHKLKVKSISCNIQFGVGIVHLQSKEDKDNLIQKIKWIPIDNMPNTTVSFTAELELISYVVIESSEAKTFPTAENLSQRWVQVYQINAPLQCKTLSDRFRNIFRLVTNSFEELMRATSNKTFFIDNLLATVYFRADCCFFEDLPAMTDSNPLKAAIINQITTMKVLKTSLYIQYNKTEANAVVLSCQQARIWSFFDSIDLAGCKIMKKDRLSDRRITQLEPTKISFLSTKTDENNTKIVVKPISSHESLITKPSDKLVFDNNLKPASTGGDDLPTNIKRSLHKKAETNEIDAENWYTTKMYDLKPDIMSFVADPQHPIFQLEWSPKAFLDQLSYLTLKADSNFGLEYGRSRMSDREKQCLLRMTVMLNTIGIVRKGIYRIGDKKIQLQSNQLKTILYDHRSLLEPSVTKSLSNLSTYPFTSTTIRVVNEDRLIIYKKMVSIGLRPVFLNMACGTAPADGYRKGYKTQEATLFCRSDYFRSLDADLDHGMPSARYYCNSNGELKPLSKYDNMYPMNEFGAIYTSGLTVFRESEENGYALMDVPITDLCTISMAAYRDSKVNNEGCLISKYSIGMRKKIENIFALAYHHRHDCLVLSAFGCGNFGNPPSHVAAIFKSVVEQYAGFFKYIYFAILDDYRAVQGSNPYGNYQPFEKLLNHKTVEPLRHKMKDMMIGPWRICNKTTNEEVRLSEVRIYTHPLCDDGGECTNLQSVKHCAEYSHPPVCPFSVDRTRCKQKFGRDHMLWFRHDVLDICHGIDNWKVDRDDIPKRPLSELDITSQRINAHYSDEKKSQTPDHVLRTTTILKGHHNSLLMGTKESNSNCIDLHSRDSPVNNYIYPYSQNHNAIEDRSHMEQSPYLGQNSRSTLTNSNHLFPRYEPQPTYMHSLNQLYQRLDDDIQGNKYRHRDILNQCCSNREDAYRQMKKPSYDLPSSKTYLQQQHYPCERNTEIDYKRHKYGSSQYRSVSCDQSSTQRYSNDSHSANCASHSPIKKNDG